MTAHPWRLAAAALMGDDVGGGRPQVIRPFEKSPASSGASSLEFTRPGLVERYADQFEPYRLFGCDAVAPFQGTLFRFPLRTAATADSSEIKTEPYSEVPPQCCGPPSLTACAGCHPGAAALLL